MARRARLSMPGVAHLVVQRGHNGGAIAIDREDLEQLVHALRESSQEAGVVLHAYALTPRELRVLATPDSAAGISRMMQSVGRRYVAGFNRRHGRSGALWDGRFRSALIAPGEWMLAALRHVDASVPHPAWADPAEAAGHADEAAAHAAGSTSEPIARSTAAHRTGGGRDPSLVDPPEYWQLGNTPFERESRWRRLIAAPLDAAVARAIGLAVAGSWAFGPEPFLAELADRTLRPLTPRPRGRPRRLEG